MEDLKPLDKFDHYPEGKGNQTIKLFLVSFTLAFITGLTVLLYSTIGLPHDSLMLFPIASGVTSFAISIGGLNVGITEVKYSTKWVKTGIAGNIVLILIPAVFILLELVSLMIYFF